MKPFTFFSVLFQILVWGIFIAQPYLNKPPQIDHYLLNFHIKHIGEWVLYILFFYLNYFLFVPQFLGKGNVRNYFLISFFVLLLIFGLVNVLEFICFGLPPDGKLISFFSLLPLMAIYSLSTSLKMLTDWLIVKSQREKLTQEKRNAELAMMRLQVSPHFLFNSLNNINALVRFNPQEAEKYIVRLSSMMRYVLKAGNEEKVLLSDEIDYMKDYINLQKLRLPQDFNISVDIKGEIKNLWIEPLLLIGFIENAFKHGVSGNRNDFIHIEMEVKNNLFRFRIENSLSKENLSKDEVSGIGIKNAKGRLEIVYPGYLLEITGGKENYGVKLSFLLQ